MLYFAYGSNMHWAQMNERCPSARFIGVAKLPDHRLAFTRRSIKRSCGVADVVADRGRQVWGVVFEIDDLDIGSLDKSEGYRPGRSENAYWRRECLVFIDGREEQPVTAYTYFAEPQGNVPRPSQAYKDLIVSGAEHWRLPAHYRAELDTIEAHG